MNKAPSYENVAEDKQSRPARAETEEDQQGTEGIGEKRDDQARHRSQMQGVGEVSGHLREVSRLLPAVLEEEASTKPKAQTEKPPVKGGGPR